MDQKKRRKRSGKGGERERERRDTRDGYVIKVPLNLYLYLGDLVRSSLGLLIELPRPQVCMGARSVMQPSGNTS
jgi:hypothetical protein